MPKTKQKILQYHIIFEPAIEGGYNVSFLNFPGCVTFGQTYEKAKANVQEVLELWIEKLKMKFKQNPSDKIILFFNR
ncbi:MAG: type II toxin-antitoxin system HicB family antitoxin [bacterium]